MGLQLRKLLGKITDLDIRGIVIVVVIGFAA